MNFKEFLEHTTNYPGNLRLPPILTEKIVNWFVYGFFNAALHNVSNNLRDAKLDLKIKNRNLNKSPEIDEKEIKYDISYERYTGDLGPEISTEDELERRIQQIKNQPKILHRNSSIIYNQLLDVYRYIKKLGIRKDFNFLEKYISNKPIATTFNIDLSEFDHVTKNIDNIKRDGGWSNNELKDLMKKKEENPLICIMIGRPGNNYLAGNAAGQYRRLDNSLSVSLQNTEKISSIQHLEDTLEDYISTIKHEIMHVIWFNIYLPLGVTKDDIFDDLDNLDNNSWSNLGYYSSRVEYPAQMISAVGEFRTQIANIMKDNKKFKVDGDVIMAFLGDESAGERVYQKYQTFLLPNEFVKTIRKKPEIWKKFVIDFYKMYMKNPVRHSKSSFGSSGFVPFAGSSTHKGKHKSIIDMFSEE